MQPLPLSIHAGDIKMPQSVRPSAPTTRTGCQLATPGILTSEADVAVKHLKVMVVPTVAPTEIPHPVAV